MFQLDIGSVSHRNENFNTKVIRKYKEGRWKEHQWGRLEKCAVCVSIETRLISTQDNYVQYIMVE